MTLEELKSRTAKEGSAQNSSVQENFFSVTLVWDNITDGMAVHCDGCFDNFKNISLYIPVKGSRPRRTSDYASEYTDAQGCKRGNVKWLNITDPELAKLYATAQILG